MNIMSPTFLPSEQLPLAKRGLERGVWSVGRAVTAGTGIGGFLYRTWGDLRFHKCTVDALTIRSRGRSCPLLPLAQPGCYGLATLGTEVPPTPLRFLALTKIWSTTAATDR